MTSHALITLTDSPHHRIFWSVLIKVLICAERSSGQLELGGVDGSGDSGQVRWEPNRVL